MPGRSAVAIVAGLLVVTTLTVPVLAQDEAQPDDDAPAGEAAGHVPSPPDYRWHQPRKNARRAPRGELYPSQEDWNPLAGPTRGLKDKLKEVGITFDLELSFLGQYASDVVSGKDILGSFQWELTGDWELLSSTDLGDGYLAWTLFGGVGLNYDAESETLSTNVGSISGLNSLDFMNDPVIVDELFWKQKLEDGKLIVIAGKVDMSYHFDTNRVANNQFDQFNALALTNNASIPFPAYGGFGGLLRANIGDNAYLMVGMGDSSGSNAVAPWVTVDNNSWYQCLEFGLTVDLGGLGKGTYRITPWHNRLLGADGWGLGLSFDQELGKDGLIGFFRFGIGDQDVTPTKTFVSGGLALDGPFGREHDTVAIGVSWSDPSSGVGVRAETLIEAYYQIQLSPSVYLSPGVQVVLNPAATRAIDSSVVAGVRLTLRF